MAKSNHAQKAQKRVDKAVGVFSQAIVQVEKAQETLSAGIQQDSHTVNALNNKIVSIQSEIAAVEQSKQEKGDQMKSNRELLNRLGQIKGN